MQLAPGDSLPGTRMVNRSKSKTSSRFWMSAKSARRYWPSMPSLASAWNQGVDDALAAAAVEILER